MKTRVLGVDIGNVICGGDTDESDAASFFGDRWLDTPELPGAFEALSALNLRGMALAFHNGKEMGFPGCIWLVSKCGARIEERTRRWLEAREFHEITRIPAERLRFCRDRAGKGPICADLGVTHFVDDRLENLGHVEATVPNRYLFRGRDGEIARNARHMVGVKRVSAWAALAADLMYDRPCRAIHYAGHKDHHTGCDLDWSDDALRKSRWEEGRENTVERCVLVTCPECLASARFLKARRFEQDNPRPNWLR